MRFLGIILATVLAMAFAAPAGAVYPWEQTCDSASQACQRSKYRRQCMCRHGCKPYCSNESGLTVQPLMQLAQHSRDNSRRRETVIPKRRYINPYHTPGVSRMVRDGRGW